MEKFKTQTKNCRYLNLLVFFGNFRHQKRNFETTKKSTIDKTIIKNKSVCAGQTFHFPCCNLIVWPSILIIGNKKIWKFHSGSKKIQNKQKEIYLFLDKNFITTKHKERKNFIWSSKSSN
jgi:hypothetical protein